MRFPMIQAIYQKELLDLVRDRRTLISMVVVPVVVLPLIFSLTTRITGKMQQNAETALRHGLPVRRGRGTSE